MLDTHASSRSLGVPVDYWLDADEVAWITLNRPHRLNAITSDLTDSLVESLGRAAADDARVVVLQGAGASFCAGHDLMEEDQPDSTSNSWAEGLQNVTRGIRAIESPVLAAVHGYALGGGFEFALAADLVVAGSSSTFGFPEVEVGLSVTGGVTMLLPRLIGPLRAKQLLFFGERLTAQQAQQLGLANWVAEDDAFSDRVRELVDALLRKPASSLILAKSALDAGLENDMETQLQLEAVQLMGVVSSKDATAARESFRSARNR